MTFPFPPDTHHKRIQGSKQEIVKYQQDQKHLSEVTPTILARDVHKRSKLWCIFLKVNRKRKTAGNQLQITTFSWTTKKLVLQGWVSGIVSRKAGKIWGKTGRQCANRLEWGRNSGHNQRQVQHTPHIQTVLYPLSKIFYSKNFQRKLTRFIHVTFDKQL